MENIKIKKEAIEIAKNELSKSMEELSAYPGYELKTIFDQSRGASTEEITEMFNKLDTMKKTIISSYLKTIQALTVIENDFELFDETFSNKFKK